MQKLSKKPLQKPLTCAILLTVTQGHAKIKQGVFNSMQIMSKEHARRWDTTEMYFVKDINDATDEQIIDFCDPNNFGGYVTRYANNCARVLVNID